MIDRRPGLIARCTGTVDVVQAVRFARQHGLLVSVRGGGHNIAGLAVCEGGLMIDMSLLRGVWVDPVQRTRARRPAARWATSTARPSCTGSRRCSGSCRPPASPASLSAAASATSRAATAGPATTVVSMEVVTADAQVLRASARRERGPVLGTARRQRQLRHRHVLRVSALSRRPRNTGRRDCLARRGCQAGARRLPRVQRQRAARTDQRCHTAHRAAGTVAAERGARPADRRDLRLPRGQDRGWRSAGGTAAHTRQAGGRHRDAPAVHADAEPARCDSTQGAALLLEVALPAQASIDELDRARARACGPHSRRPIQR